MVTFNRPKAGVILSKHQITSFCCSKRSHGSVSQLRTNSSPQPSRSYVIWLLLLLYCTHSDPPKQDSVLLLEHRRYAPNFALAVPPYWNTLLPYDMTLPNLQQVFFQMSRTQTHLDYPIRSATRTPYFPSLLYLL